MVARRFEDSSMPGPDASKVWPVYWSAIWVGTLSALAFALVAGLAGVALGAQIVRPERHLVSWSQSNVHFGGIVWTVCSAFFSFVIGGWVAGRIAGHPRSESAMLHGAITWLVAIPILIVAASLGAGGFFGGWYSGLAGSPVWMTPREAIPGVDQLALVRNNALGAVTALLVSLIGSVLGGWMASGEPMSIFHYQTRTESNESVIVTETSTPLAR